MTTPERPVHRSWPDLPEPVLAEPPNCACRGRAPQMREHTTTCCSVLTTKEVNDLSSGDPVRFDAGMASLEGVDLSGTVLTGRGFEDDA
jgi:hypothetical protein